MGTFSSGIRYNMYREVFATGSDSFSTALELPFADTNKFIFLNHMTQRAANSASGGTSSDLEIQRRVLLASKGPSFSEAFETVATGGTGTRTDYRDYFSPFEDDGFGDTSPIGKVRFLMPGDRIRFRVPSGEARLLIIWTEVVIGGLFSVKAL